MNQPRRSFFSCVSESVLFNLFYLFLSFVHCFSKLAQNSKDKEKRLIEKEVKRREKIEEERNNSIVEKQKEGGVRNKLCFVLERASFASPLSITKICTPRISEPELEQ